MALSRILITGANGFAGPYLAQRLASRGHEVIGLGRLAKPPPVPAISRWLVADLTSLAAVRAAVAKAKPEAVVHLAAISYVAHGDAADIYANNIVGTRNLLEVLAAAPPPGPVIITSSANIYGNRNAGRLDESTLPDPRSDYALSKLACEHLATMYSDRLATMVVRPFNYTGVGQDQQFLIPKLIAHAAARAAEIKLGNLEVARDFSDVRHVADMFCRLLDCPAAIGRVINICSGHAVSLIELLDLVASLSGHRPKVEIDEQLVRAHEVDCLWGDDALLQSLVGPVSGPPLAETLQWMLDAAR